MTAFHLAARQSAAEAVLPAQSAAALQSDASVALPPPLPPAGIPVEAHASVALPPAGIPGFQQHEQSETRTEYCRTHNNWHAEHIGCEYCGSSGFDSVHFRGPAFGFEESACSNGVHGMFPDTCEECLAVVEANMADFALRPLHVVLTGTFPQLGGGSGLKIGKVKLQQLVESTAHGKVVSALSCKVTHMVTGVNPGAAKLQQSQQYGYMKVVTYDEFLPIINEKLRNPPVLETKKQKQQKKRAAADVAADDDGEIDS